MTEAPTPSSPGRTLARFLAAVVLGPTVGLGVMWVGLALVTDLLGVEYGWAPLALVQSLGAIAWMSVVVTVGPRWRMLRPILFLLGSALAWVSVIIVYGVTAWYGLAEFVPTVLAGGLTWGILEYRQGQLRPETVLVPLAVAIALPANALAGDLPGNEQALADPAGEFWRVGTGPASEGAAGPSSFLIWTPPGYGPIDTHTARLQGTSGSHAVELTPAETSRNELCVIFAEFDRRAVQDEIADGTIAPLVLDPNPLAQPCAEGRFWLGTPTAGSGPPAEPDSGAIGGAEAILP